jgi:hypothetical protein
MVMAHYAQLDENNVVTQVIVVANEHAATEEAGLEFIASLNLQGIWKQTSYNTFANKHALGGTPFRKNYAGIGYVYDETKDAFIPPKPVEFPSFVLDEETCVWVNPVPRPQGTETIGWEWNEDTLSWESFTKTPK